MDAARGYLTVAIPVHPYFLPKKKNGGYEEKVLAVLSEKKLNLTDLAREMGYKGITQKLKRTVEALLQAGVIEKAPSEKNGIVFQKNRGSLSSFHEQKTGPAAHAAEQARFKFIRGIILPALLPLPSAARDRTKGWALRPVCGSSGPHSSS